jgi:hypothetical protein
MFTKTRENIRDLNYELIKVIPENDLHKILLPKQNNLISINHT